MKNFKNKEAEDIESEANHRNQAGDTEDIAERKAAVDHAEDTEKDIVMIAPEADPIAHPASNPSHIHYFLLGPETNQDELNNIHNKIYHK
jgi:hypothetical protein